LCSNSEEYAVSISNVVKESKTKLKNGINREGKKHHDLDKSKTGQRGQNIENGGFFKKVKKKRKNQCNDRGDRGQAMKEYESHNKLEIKGRILPLLRCIISILLIIGGIEQNPGENDSINLISCNVRGLRSHYKRKLLFNKIHKLSFKHTSNFVFFLQETHFNNSDVCVLDNMLKLNRIDSFGSSRQKGVTIIYNSQKFDEILEYFNDDEGRINILITSKNEHVYIFVNVYAPNDHSIKFFVCLFELISRMKFKYPGSYTFVGGDFNLVIDSNLDSVNRKQTKLETDSRDFLLKQCSFLELNDVFRCKNGNKMETTWRGRGIESRLDYWFISRDMVSECEYSVDHCFTSSDHSAVAIKFDIKNSFKFGPGIRFVDGQALKDPTTRDKIMADINESLEGIPDNWNDNIKWDYTKMIVRQCINKYKGMNFNQLENCVINIESEINRAIKYKSVIDSNKYEECLNNLRTELEGARVDFARFLAIRSRSNYYEKGEKSSKYFLNQMKERRKRTFIDCIVGSDGERKINQADIKQEIFDFYKSLYSKQSLANEYDSTFFADLPQVREEDNLFLASDISLEEIENFLKNCKSTSPGQDGLHYEIYKDLWPIINNRLIRSWEYSIRAGELSTSQRRTTITLIDKKGKDKTLLKNLRPIALANCDLKIFTKILAKRLDRVLSYLIHPSQKAYIKGRNVHDNLRFIDLWKSYCISKGVDGVIVALDAKKAFDSVDHKYLFEVLKRYGFSEGFIDIIRMLYRNLESNVMVNGYTTDNFILEQCVKQGDALSCGLFILCVDPLIRNINKNINIRSITFISPFTQNSTDNKTQGFADDITVVTLNDQLSIDCIFEEYERFSKFSGIFLNADKTEIISTKGKRISFSIKYCNEVFNIESVDSVVICGRTFSYRDDLEIKANIKNKINKLEKQLNIWRQRDLSLEGKIIIVKTFGLSQLIYSMQNQYFDLGYLIEIERIIFDFVWSKRGKGGRNERIKRKILKNKYEKGGLKAPDIFSIDYSLKTKYFLDCIKNDNNEVSIVTDYILHSAGNITRRSYFYLNEGIKDGFIFKGLEGINRIFNMLENDLIKNLDTGVKMSRRYADCVSTVDLGNYKAKSSFDKANLNEMYRKGFVNFNFIYNCIKFPSSDRYILRNMQLKQSLPEIWFRTLDKFNNFDTLIKPLDYILCDTNNFKRLNKIKTKDIRELFTYSECIDADLDKIKLTFGLDSIPERVFLNVRKSTVSSKLRNTQFRILHNDVYTKTLLHKIGIVENPLCDRCKDNNIEILESICHQIIDCPSSINCWKQTEDILAKLVNENISIDKNKILFGFNYLDSKHYRALNTILAKIRNNFIQINRPVINNFDKIVKNQIQEVIDCEKIFLRSLIFEKKWTTIDNNLKQMRNQIT